MGGSNASAADVKQSLEGAISAGEEHLHRSKTCWLQLKYAVDDEGTLKLFTHTPGKSPISCSCIACVLPVHVYLRSLCQRNCKARKPACFLLDVTCGIPAMQPGNLDSPWHLSCSTP